MSIDVGTGIVDQTTVTTNLAQEVHVTTRDKVELALRRVLPRYSSTEQLLAILGVALAFGGSLLTADFRQRLGIPATAWQTVFALGFLASLAWLGVEGRRWRKRPKLEDVVNEVMKSSDRLP